MKALLRCGVLLVLGLWAGRGLGQASAPVEPADLSADNIRFETVDGKNVIIGEGNVHVAYGGVELRCDYAEFAKDENKVMARGNVAVRSAQYEVHAEEGEYDFNEKTGKLKNGTAVYAPKGWDGELYCQGEVVRAYPDMLVMEKGSFTTCDKKHPHYRVSARRVLIFPGNKAIGKRAAFWVGRVPILYTPYARKSLGATHFRFKAGHRNILGMYASLTYVRPIKVGKETVTEWRVDAMQKQGAGFGIKATSEWEGLQGGRGELNTYYATGGEEPEEYEDEPRWLVKAWMLERFTEELVIKGKTDIMSDPDVLKHFFWREYKDDPTIETYLNVAWLKERYSAYGLVDVNPRDFETDVTRTPQFDFDLKRTSLGQTGLLFDFDSQIADLKNGLVPDEDTEEGTAAEITAAADEEETVAASQQDVAFIRTDRDILRYDQTIELSRPFRVADLVGIEPLALYEGTYFSDLYQGLLLSADGTEYEPDIRGSDWRNAITGQVQARTTMYRTYEDAGFVPNAELLRHEIEPTLTYAYRPDPSVSADNLVQFDKIDALDPTNSVGLELVNRWEKKNVSGEKSQVARVDAGIMEEMAEGQKSFVTLEMWLSIWEPWRFKTDTRYDISASEIARSNSVLVVNPVDRLDFQFGCYYYPRETGTDNLDLEPSMILTILEGLKVSCEATYDVGDSNMEEVEIALQKSLHCWNSVISYTKRREDDEQEIAFSLWIKAIPDFEISASNGMQ